MLSARLLPEIRSRSSAPPRPPDRGCSPARAAALADFIRGRRSERPSASEISLSYSPRCVFVCRPSFTSGEIRTMYAFRPFRPCRPHDKSRGRLSPSLLPSRQAQVSLAPRVRRSTEEPVRRQPEGDTRTRSASSTQATKAAPVWREFTSRARRAYELCELSRAGEVLI